MTSPPDQPERHFPAETSAQGPWGGPVYSYRGAEIRCNRGGHVCALLMSDHPLHGSSFGVVGTITLLVDLWVKERRLPSTCAPCRTPARSSQRDGGPGPRPLGAFVAVGKIERWIAGRPWKAMAGGWTVPGELQGWRFRLKSCPVGCVRIVARLGVVASWS